MKNLFILLSLIATFSSCSQNENEIPENSIIGKWKLIEKMDTGNDGLPVWTTVNETETYTYTFKEEGTVINSRTNCNGIYNLNESNATLNIKYDCTGNQDEGNFNLIMENNIFVLSPIPNLCDEGCAEKFIKIIE